MLRIQCAGVLATLSAYESGERCVRWLASGDPVSLRSSLRTGPVCTGHVRCDAVECPVVVCRHACAIAVGGNGRVQTASDTWLTPEHRTLGVEDPWDLVSMLGEC